MVLAQAQRDTIQKLPDAQTNDNTTGFFALMHRGPLLSAWGTRLRETELRRVYRHDYNWMVQGAFSGLLKRLASTPWEIKGPEDISGTELKFYEQAFKTFGRSAPQTSRPDTEYWQEIIRQADFGRGWSSFIKKGVDYLRQDGGWYWEIIAPGNTLKEPTGPASGIAHLDSVRCIPTGDPEFPVVYIDRDNNKHILHNSRVVHLVDMPDGDESRPGYGLCALARAISITHRQILMGRYIEQHLDDKPPPGIVSASGITRQERDRAASVYREEQDRDDRPIWGRQLWFFGADVGNQARLETTTFSVAPEKFDFKTYTEIDIDALALALGVDRQDLWQLTGGNLGSGTQSEILSQKSRGKALGDLMASIERAINDILPENYQFEFKFRDEQEDETRANIASTWASTVQTAGSHLTDDEARRLLANQIEAIHEAITDEKGQIVRRDDLDVQGISNADIQAQQDQQQPPANAPQQERQRAMGEGVDRQRNVGVVVDAKDFQATRLSFEIDVSDLIGAAIDRELEKRRAGTVLRALLNRHGKQAMLDGLEKGGVDTELLEGDDLSTFTLWLAEQSTFVSKLMDELYKDPAPNIDPDVRAGMWANKSLIEIYQQGILSADRNGLYEWVLGDTEHCADCLRLAGQIHRFKDWSRTGWLPQADHLECHGYNCQCKLVKTSGRARGRF